MTYLYQQVNIYRFRDAFRTMGRAEQFSHDGLDALFEYLENLASDCGEPLELDVVALCCDFCEYEDLATFNAEQGAEYGTWDDVADDYPVLMVGDKGAIVSGL